MAFAYSLYKLCKQVFGDKLYEMRPSVRVLALPEELRTVENINKLGAYSVTVETNRFENDYRVFEKVVLALNENTVDPEELHPPAVPEICWALFEISLEKPKMKFSEEVSSYVITVLKEEGYVYVPDELSPFRNDLVFEDPELAELQERVKKRWPQVAREEDPQFSEIPEDIQLARLWACKRYVEERKRELEKELEELTTSGVLV